MHASNKPQPDSSLALAALPPELVQAVASLGAGSRGWTVRCTPTRRTVVAMVDGAQLYAKLRCGRRRDAVAEWHWLHALPAMGVRTPAPVAFLGSPRRSVLVTAGVAGRSFDSWAVAALAEGWFDGLVRQVCNLVAPVVKRLHDHGVVYRDLYWNHIFSKDPRTGAEPVFLDVERAMRPRWLWRRWVVKDLAGLLASAPDAAWGRPAVRFLRAYLGGTVREHRHMLAAVSAKAARIRGHAPRFG